MIIGTETEITRI